MQKLIGMTLEQLRQVAAECGLPSFAAKQIARRLYVNRAQSFDEMTELSKRGRELLSQNYCIGLTFPKAEARSSDGTIKCLFEGRGGRDVEAVYIPDHDRATLCVSSQAGCKMGCKFCMTGRQGFHGNLDSADIINQILSIPNSESLTNIVFMGMGEPMDNLPAVLQAIEVLTAPWGFAWSPKRITVSTIGKIPELKRLLNETKVHIAISVHSPYPGERAELMPSEKAWPLSEVIELLRGYDFAHQRRLTLEYIIWRGINDDLRHADALARLVKGVDCRVNLIRYHSLPDSDLQTASEATMTAFRDRLNALGVTATIRASRGEDIQAACGMLAGQQNK
ncbi:MAG: 23S rRNA (adenine(2503)-C(2))-methyltransferase RlmN [Bacteroides sp.]|nr:23S rRNA (adenine(2503)-C(2))-methyltransferase RlmN [Bacteroides sp.]MCM1378569.1 23S rRNA (adenine(2503)-C(2))-methyltransferase RlmN [Bacteroides sp.]MCM1444870.1 23S rRNA (adenine(2503)-C(2))-methyltransferase RlmN [Prevotella sp.]